MQINQSGAQYSSIVEVTERLKQLEAKTGKHYLRLNRGVNAVKNIDLEEVIPLIDFNSSAVQVYNPNSGKPELKEAINKVYFQKKSSPEHIVISAGGMNALDLTIQSIDVETIYFAKYFWAAYPNITVMRGKKPAIYENFQWLYNHMEEIKGQAVIICDPNNPVGNKMDDEQIIQLVKKLDANGTLALYDSPYRRVFKDDEDALYAQIAHLPNVIIHESFSKSMGLSGQRIGFVHSANQDFLKEFRIRLLYETNSINGFAQNLVYHLLTSEEGKQAVNEFKCVTAREIKKNIAYLREKKFLAEEFYPDSEPVGIFVVANRSSEELLKHRIGSVSLKHFTMTNKEEADRYARICVSVPHEKLKAYFEKIND